MKILFTGSTSKQTDDNAFKRAQVKRIDDSTIICESLRKSGNEVIRKEVQHGEDLSSYDIGIVGVGALGSSNYGNIFSALYAIANLKKVIVFHEDWKIKDTIKSFKQSLEKKDVESHIKKKWSSGDNFYSNITDNIDIKQIYSTMENILDGKYDCLVPSFEWGDKSIIADILQTSIEKINTIDLTPYSLKAFGIEEKQMDVRLRDKKYMLASLVDHSSWVKRQKLEHDVDYYGCKKLKSPRLDDEKHVFETMNKYWGILCPVYPHAGSGWFRIRYIYSAMNRNILIMDKKDSDALGIDHIAKIDPSWSTDELLQIAEKQRMAIYKHLTTEEDFDRKINSIIYTLTR